MQAAERFRGVFQPAELTVLDEAFEAAWEAVIARRPFDDEPELKVSLGELICSIALVERTHDAMKLKEAALKCFAHRYGWADATGFHPAPSSNRLAR